MGRNSKNRKVITRSESGTCNVCSAPCSSCMHINRGLNTVKAEESSGETCQQNIGSQYSVTDVPVKKCDSGQPSASETSNVNSNRDINCGDNDSASGMKSCDVSRASDDVEMPPATPSGVNAERLCNIKGNHKEQKGMESHEGSTSCVISGSEANRLASPKKEVIESSCSEEKNEGVWSSKLTKKMSYSPSGKSVSCNPIVKDRKEKLVSKDHINGEGHSLDLEEACLKVEGETNAGPRVASKEVDLKLESETPENTLTEKQLDKIDHTSAQNNETEVESCELAGLHENKTKSQPMIDLDESDVLEHDVKVCDICGDAGLEDLLAICSRCSDGAEHTYCMREMLQKVPEGDWLCEECKPLDEANSKDVYYNRVAGDKCQSSEGARAGDTDFSLNVDRKDVDTEATKPRRRILGKRDIDDRPTEDIETSSLAKKQALGLTLESPKGTRRLASLSRDSSFKNLNKDETKPHQSSSSEALEDSSSLRGLRRQEARSTLSRSSTFSTNPRSKGDINSEVSQKQKAAREPVPIDKKEDSSKVIGRSMSFRPSSLSRLNHSESKVKMLSSKFHPQDVKGIRQAKAQNILERKSSFKPEHQLANSRISSSTVSASNSDQKLKLGDPPDGELKGVPSDNKPSTLSKSTSFIARKGEMKINNVPDQKPKEAGVKDDSLSGNSRGGLLGVSPRSQETERPGERTRDGSVSRYRTNIVNDASATRSSADVIKGNKLKAAIEAAMLKKPGICRKNKPTDQSDEVSVPSSNLNSEPRSEDILSTSSKRSNVSCANEAHEKQATSNNGDQTSLPLGSSVSLKLGDNGPIAPSSMSYQPSATVSILLKMPVLPEHEYIWQGGFDIRKIGKLADFRDGLQAHLSTCASPKVLEVVAKFPSKLLLHEVPRMSIWPVQFQEIGVKEDNIALYFFAKDLESYERSYKYLLETMMRRDLALKGNYDGVELLIFPSTHLPQNAQRWNMLYFLWGVFKGKKANYVPNVTDLNSRNASQASDGPATIDLPAISKNISADNSNSATLALESHISDIVIAVPDSQVSFGDSNGHCLQGNAEKQDLRVDAKRVGGVSVPETKVSTNPMEENVDTKAKPDVAKLQPSVEDPKTNPPNARQSQSSSGTSARACPSSDLLTLEKTVKKEDESIEASSVQEINKIVLLETKEPNESQFSKKRPHEDPIPETLDASLVSEGEPANKKQKMNCDVVLEGDNKAPKRGFVLDLNETQDYSPEGPSPAAKQEKGGLFDLNVAQDEEGDDSSLLSLSLPFPLSSTEPEVKPMPKVEPFLPGRPNTRSSHLFFDGLSKK